MVRGPWWSVGMSFFFFTMEFCCEDVCSGTFWVGFFWNLNLRVPNAIPPRNKALFPGRYHFVSLDSHHRVLNILV